MFEAGKLPCYFHHPDRRGLFLGHVNQGIRQEGTFVKTQARQFRCRHCHTRTNEVIFLVRGKAEVELQDCDLPQQKQPLILNPGERVQIKPDLLHNLEDSEQLALLNVPFAPAHPELHTLTLVHSKPVR